MDNNSFKKLNRPSSCTEAPFKYLIPKEIREETLLKIKHESLDIYGEDLSGECNKRLVCASKTCLGRPLPVLSPTAKPYIEQLAKTQNIINDELFIVTNCSNCPIVKSCTSTCNQINDYIQRDKVKEPIIYYKTITDDIIADIYSEEGINFTVDSKDIPWDCLSEKRINIVKMYIYQEKDFKHIANLLNINNPAYVKYLFYSSLTKLSKYGVIRKFLKTNPKISKKRKYIIERYFIANKTLTEISKELNITKQTCQVSLKIFYKKNKLRWIKYVSKKDGKVTYNVTKNMK